MPLIFFDDGDDMMGYKYQMHTHTFPCSHCSAMSPEELVENLNKKGYKGCVITNHFRSGNTGIDRSIPWNDFVAAYEKDWLECKKCAQKYDLDIIFGIEEHVGKGLEILCYGITPEFLYSHPELIDRSISNWYNALNSVGALCIQAHPFRERDYIPLPKVLPLDYIDGIEVYNAANSPDDNMKAKVFAQKHPELILISGADTHNTQTVAFGGIETSERIVDEKELVRILKSGNYSIIE